MHSEALPPARTGALMREAISMHSEALPPARTGAPDHRNASRAARRTPTWPRHGRRRGRRGRWNERRRGHRGLWNGRRHGLLLLLMMMIRRCCDCELHRVHEGSRCRRQRRRRGVEGRARARDCNLRARARDRAELGLEIELISAHELARFSRSVIEKPLEIRPLLELALPDDCNQALSAAIRGNQRDPSTPRARAARCNQAPSAAPCEAIRGHQRPSVAISGHRRPSEVIKGHQRPSEVISELSPASVRASRAAPRPKRVRARAHACAGGRGRRAPARSSPSPSRPRAARSGACTKRREAS